MKTVKLAIAALALMSSLAAASAKDAYISHSSKAATVYTESSATPDNAARAETADPLHQQIFRRSCTQNYGTGYCN